MDMASDPSDPRGAGAAAPANPAMPAMPAARGGGLIVPLAALIDRVVADPGAREAAKLELLRGTAAREIERLAGAATPADRWAGRSRPAFLYVMYALLLWAIPMGLIAAADPRMAEGIARGMNAYLNGLPEPLYALFGTGYLGYTVARSWGKARGAEK